jgi:hypothetical protein
MENPNLRTLLAALERCTESANGWEACCPAHDDTNPSLSISQGDDGRILLHCQSNECKPENIMQAAGLSAKDMFVPRPSNSSNAEWGNLVQAYDYTDEEGTLLFQVCRFEKSQRQMTGEDVVVKTFRQRKPDGDNGWNWRVGNTRRVLYQLPKILAESDDYPVFVVEGEKQVHFLESVGLIATCNPQGAGKWKAEFAESLAGRDVVVVPDNDPIVTRNGKTHCTGMEHAEQVADSLVGKARSVHVILLPDAQPKWGLDDWLQNGHTTDDLNELLNHAEPWEFATKLFDRGTVVDSDSGPMTSEQYFAQFRATCSLIGIDVLGEMDNGKILCYSREYRKTADFRDISKLKMEDMLQFAGPVGASKIFTGRDNVPAGMTTMVEVRAAIASLGGLRKIEDSLYAAGVWQFDDTTVLVGAGEIVTLNGKFDKLEAAEYNNRVFDLNSVKRPWFDTNGLAQAWASATNHEWCQSVLNKAEKIFSQWAFRNEEFGSHPQLLTGLIMATWLQSIWKWRPQVFILGESNAGKSVLFQCLAGSESQNTSGIFGSLAIKSSDYTAAALHQGIGRSSKVAICDEFESGGERGKILKMVRSAGRGDSITRGTASGKMISDYLRQMFWMASTESGLKREVDQNRFVVVELVMSTDVEKRRRFVQPSDEDLQKLGLELLAIAIRHSRRAKALATLLYTQRPPGINDRICESYAIPAAMYASGAGFNDAQAYDHYVDLLKLTEPEDVESDRNQVISDILDSTIRLPKGETDTVGGLLSVGIAEHSHLESVKEHTLEAHGVAIRDHLNGEKCIFFYPRSIARKLLKDTDFADARIADYLKRIPGSIRCRKYVSGIQVRGFLIPVASIPSLVRQVEESLISPV